MSSNFEIIEKKLEKVRAKYHRLELYKGIIYFLLIGILYYLIIAVTEYYNYFNTSVRKVFFFSTCIFIFLLFIRYILIPVTKLVFERLRINNTLVNKLIIKVYPELKDKLINVLELKDIKNTTHYSEAILNAAVNQKVKQIIFIDFLKSVDFKTLRSVLLYFITSVVLSVVIYAFDRDIYSESTQRIIHYSKSYYRPAPYHFRLLNNHLKVNKGDNLTIRLQCEGDDIPQIIYINIGENNFLMSNKGSNYFEYLIPSVINPFSFYFTDLKYESFKYGIEILPKPGINYFSLNVSPPAYTNLPESVVENVGDLQIPAGTKLKWGFSGIDIDSLIMVLNDSINIYSTKNDKAFITEKQVFRSFNYKILIKNKTTQYEQALNYGIEVDQDLYPEILVNFLIDSVKYTQYYFKGTIGDDYGFRDLKFHINCNEKDSSFSLPVIKSLNNQDFYFSYDFNDSFNRSGDVTFYFSVTDNDPFNNFKTTTSESFVFHFPDEGELISEGNEQFNNIEQLINESEKLTQEIKDDLKNLQLDEINSNSTKWEKSQQINQILSKKNYLEDLLNRVQQNNQKLTNYMNSFNGRNEDILKKQNEIQDLLEQVFTDELRKLLEEFSKLAKEFDNKLFNQLKDKLDFSLDDLNAQLEKNLEMLKRFKIEQGLEEIIDELKNIGNEEEKLAEEINRDKNFSEIFSKDSLNLERVNNSNNHLNNILDENNGLKKPLNFDNFKEEYDRIKDNFFNNQKYLKDKNKRQAQQSIKNTSQKIKELAFSMTQMLNSNKMEQNFENIENLRQILSNLIIFSFSEEELINRLEIINTNDPSLIEVIKTQVRLKEQNEVIRDSLYALAQRTSQINGLINNELIRIENNLSKSINELKEGIIPNARTSQQFIMTSVNNLALLLDEALENLEKQMAEGMEGDQQCENPNGRGKEGLSLLKKQGENLKQQLEQMIKQLKEGRPEQFSRQLSESLMQHEMMQQMLRDIINSGELGSNSRKQLQDIDNLLEQSRKELMNKQIGNNTLIRQNQILSKLLESEKAEMERDIDNKRESESAREEFYSKPAKYFENREKNNINIENFEKENFKLKSFYNNKLKQYITNLQDGAQQGR